MIRNALALTPMIWPLFVYVGLPTHKNQLCVSCGKEVRESYTQDKLPVLINSQARPYFLIEKDGHRFGKFAAAEVHSHEAE